jgi:hypothetical protein
MQKVSEDFMPKTFHGLLPWMNNLDQKAPTTGLMVGLTPAQITDLQDNIQQVIDAINGVTIKRSELDEALSIRNMLRGNQLQVIRHFIALIKMSPNYTPAIGAQLGIIANALMIDTTLVKPVLKLSIEAGNVRIAFRKKGMKGISIFSRQRGTMSWQKIAQINTSPYVDTRSLIDAGKPEAREYIALFQDGLKEIGQESEIYSILTGTQAAL